MIRFLSKKFQFNYSQIDATVKLLDQGATVPFIARYRKEATSNLDEVAIMAIRDAVDQYRELQKRKEYIISVLEEQGNLSPELKKSIDEVELLTELEDLYLPFKPKRNTKAEIARKKGLEPLAKIIMAQNFANLEQAARKFVGKDKAANTEEALEGAGYIIAEWINENTFIRKKLRSFFQHEARMTSKLAKDAQDENAVYKNYYERELISKKMSSHQILALFRGEKEGVLKLKLRPDKERALSMIDDRFIKRNSACPQLLQDIILDAYNRLLRPSLEKELRAELKLRADQKAIDIFKKNLEQLLMLPPMPNKRILAIDPGFRTGCKIVCLDEQGILLHNQTIYPHPPQRESKQAMKTISTLVQQFQIDAIAIGNGTAGRETENLIRRMRFNQDIVAIMVNENGASVYSASKLAREEFPEYDITVRGAVSIGRRLSDPLAELVKIDPKAIGVGQYQHDVDQNLLKKSLDDVVINCVNKVGIDVNTASKELLQYVAGLGPVLAENMVQYRKEHGPFQSREELKKVARLGNKAYEQASGFIRIRNAKNPLDNTGVHPEAYEIIENMAKKLGVKVADLLGNESLIRTINPEDFTTESTGIQGIKELLKEVLKPNRDPRKKSEIFEFSKEVNRVEDLKIGMTLPGIITNITGFGAFCDMGVHQDGLIHISKLADKFVADPHEVVSLNQYVEVEVIALDIEHKRINLKLIK